jgi:hypothetical protein
MPFGLFYVSYLIINLIPYLGPVHPPKGIEGVVKMGDIRDL